MSKQQVVNELHRSARKNFNRRHFQMRGINDTFQADLIEMIPYAKENKNYKYILTVIDTFSKYAWALPLKTKTGIEVAKALNNIVKNDKRIPKNIHTDEGKEFYNKHFKKIMETYHINHYSTYTRMKASIVERFNRTLLTKLWKYLSLQGTHKWWSGLQSLVNQYNNSKHRTIKCKPIDVNKSNEELLLHRVYKNKTILHEVYQFNENDYVRISKYKNIFEKGYTPNWTTEIFQIRKKQATNPITYLLTDLSDRDIKGTFYKEELQKVRYPDVYLVEKILRKKKDKVFVKWLGFDDSFNSWINKTDIL